MNKLSLAFAVGSIGSMLLGITEGCGTTESPGGGRIIAEGGVAGAPGTEAGPIGSSRTPIGKPCLKDSECGGRGVICLASTSRAFDGGGPPNGMCVADCTKDPCRTSNVDCTICAAFDPTSICVGVTELGDTAYCLQGCNVGPTPTGDEKCHDRPDVACDDHGGPGFCKPMCRNDADCGTRKCDLLNGVCRDAKDVAGTVPLGTPCDPTAKVDTCIGACLPLTANDAGTGPGMCRAFCAAGNLGCGEDPNSPDPHRAACLFNVTTAVTPGAGDLGLCGQLCDCNDECKAYQRTACIALQASDRSFLGRAGFCGPPTNPDTGKPTDFIPCVGTPDAAGPGKPDSGGAKDAGSD